MRGGRRPAHLINQSGKFKIRTLENHKGCGTPSYFFAFDSTKEELIESLVHPPTRALPAWCGGLFTVEMPPAAK